MVSHNKQLNDYEKSEQFFVMNVSELGFVKLTLVSYIVGQFSSRQESIFCEGKHPSTYLSIK